MLVFVLSCSQNIVAQTKGTVSDKSGVTLPGVNVVEKGVQNGVSTNFNGGFELVLKKEKSILVFSYLGFKTIEVAVTKNSELNIVLEEEVSVLSDVIVVGYGSQIKREVTSSISTIKDFDTGGNTSIGELMQGKSSGLQIATNGATPGAAMRITVRGTNSINSGTEPLWIIDGITVNSDQQDSPLRSSGVLDINNPLADLNPDDIESIQVLKDAASTSIYGSRGANGVILVTTKQGSTGKIKTRISFESGASKAVNYKKYVSGEQYYDLIDEAWGNSGFSSENFFPGFFDFANPKYDFYDREYAETVNNNWIDQILRTGEYQKLYASISGGSAGSKYFVSLYNKNAKGVMIGDDRKDYGFTGNLDLKVSKKLDLGFNTRMTYNDYQISQKGGGAASRINTGATNWGGRGGWKGINTNTLPVYPKFTPEGDLFDPWGGYNPYPASLAENQLNDNQSYSMRLIGSLKYKILDNLIFNTKGGFTYSNRSNFIYINSKIRRKSADDMRGSSRGIQNYTTTINSTFNATLNYNKRFDDFKLNFLLGTEMNKNLNKVDFADYEDLTSQQIAIGDAQSAVFLRGQNYEQSNLFGSFFGRLNGSFRNKYLFGLTIRYDGSSVFAPENRWGGFGAISSGWIISDESFMEGKDLFNLLKLRVSYGSSGNASIPSFKWLNNYQTWAQYGTAPGLVPSNLATDNLTWEKSITTDIAIDYGILNNRISGSIGYYDTTTKDMLLNAPIAPSVGIYSGNNGPTALLNVGEMSNAGFEFEIGTTNIRTKDFTWKTTFNISSVKNTVGDLSDGIENPLQISYVPAFGSGLAVSTVWTGHKLGRFFIAEYAGLDDEGFQTIYEIDQDKFEESGFLVTEKTGNVIRATAENIQNNRKYQDGKTGLPTYFGGFSNTFKYKGISLSILFNFSGGNYIYDQSVKNNGTVGAGRNVINADLYGNTWIKDVREDSKYPIQTWNNFDFEGKQMSTEHTAYLHKGDYIRLQNIKLGYKFQKNVLSKLKVDNFEIYMNATNLMVFSKFKEFDPEFVNYGDIHSVAADRNLGQGYVKYDPFPKATTISIGTTIGF